jgi:membrane fusion protein (multidrug efflux system)
VHVTEGDEVKADAIVISLDRYGPSSNYTQTNAVYLNAKKSYEQLKFLFDEGAVSESRFDAARTQYQVAEAELAAVTRRLDIESPISGRVTSVDVSPGDITQVGQAVVTVASTDRLRVTFVVNADYVKTLKPGAEVLISSDALDATATGTITTVSTSANKDSRSFPVEALMDNSGGLFHPGMYVHVDYIIDRLTGVLVVPREAVLNIDGQTTVFKAVGGRAVMTPVTLGDVLEGDVMVLSGVSASDTLITIGQEYLEDGLILNMTELQEQTK